MIRYLYTTTLAHGIMVEVDIRAFVEAMVRGVLGRRGQIVVDVCEAKLLLVMSSILKHRGLTVSTKTPLPAAEAWY